MPNQIELAKLAGVSAGTVSNVISGSKRVSEVSRKKVLEAVRALNYQPNLIARSLRTRKTNTLGIIVPDITIPFFPKVIRGAESACRTRSYFLIVLDSQHSHSLELDMIAMLRRRVDGILLVTAGGYKWSAETAAQIISGPPIVCVDRLPESLDVDSVCVDDCSAAELGVSHLLSLGHTEIAIITGPLTLKNEQERLKGYELALSKAGLPARASLVWPANFDSNDIEGVCRKGLLNPEDRPSALFATNGVTGLAALRAIYAMGLSTPKDIAFVTFDEVTVEEFFTPGITSVIQPTHDIGYRAVEVLLDRIAQSDTNQKRSNVRLPATLQVRQSSRGLAPGSSSIGM